MKASALKKLIKEAVKEAIQEELKEVLLEAVKAPKIKYENGNSPIPLKENISHQPLTPQLSSTEKRKKYMDIIGETALNLTSKDAQTFNPRGNIDTTSPSGQLPAGEVGMDQIMGLMTNR